MALSDAQPFHLALPPGVHEALELRDGDKARFGGKASSKLSNM